MTAALMIIVPAAVALAVVVDVAALLGWLWGRVSLGAKPIEIPYDAAADFTKSYDV